MKRKKKKNKMPGAVLDVILEAGLLKCIRRSGWKVVGVPNPESVADHSFRCAFIAYFLAHAEEADPYKAMVMSLFNDLHEARIGDLCKMAQHYIESQKAEDDAFFEQISSLPGLFKKELIAMRSEYRSQKSKESKVARDADILECLIQARQYSQSGYKLAQKFTVQAPDYLETKSGRQLWQKAKTANLNQWWQALGQFRR